MSHGGHLMDEDASQTLERRLIALAVEYGRSHQSPQTGWVHLCPHEAEEGRHDGIPVFFNFLFALALMRSKVGDQVQEGKEILSRLLAFQGDNGQFPVHLHQFPVCHDPYLGGRLLAVSCLIWRDFHHVMGEELRKGLRGAMASLLEGQRRRLQEREGPWWQRYLLGAGIHCWGELQAEDDWKQWGTDLATEALVACKDEESLFSERLGELCLAEQLWDASRLQTWVPYYDPFRGVALGLGHREYQWDGEPKSSYYELLMAAQYGRLSEKALRPGPHQLWGALVERHMELDPQSRVYEGSLYGEPSLLQVDPEFSISLLGQRGQDPAPTRPAYHVLRLLWGSTDRVHSWVCQVPATTHCEWTREGQKLYLDFYLQARDEEEELWRQPELSFYVDEHESLSIRLAGKQSTTYQLGEELEVKSSGMRLRWQCVLKDGDGAFFGHLMPGNRPAQQHLKDAARFQAYDWHIFLRTLRREGPCHLRVEMEWIKE